MDCRKWGIQYPHVSGQSVVLSGGYEMVKTMVSDLFTPEAEVEISAMENLL